MFFQRAFGLAQPPIDPDPPQTPQRNDALPWWDVLLFSSIIAVLYLLIFRYRFNDANQQELLLTIRRLQDPTFLANDFFVNSIAEFGPRYWVARFLEALASAFSLPLVYFALTYISFWATAWITYRFALLVCGEDVLGALMSCALFLSIQCFLLGQGSFVRNTIFMPMTLATPFALVALRDSFRGHFIRCALFALPALLLHPNAAEITLAGLIATTLHLIIAALRRERPLRLVFRELMGATACGLVILLATYWVWMRPQHAAASAQWLVDAWGKFRAPHHHIPSRFGAEAWAMFTLFVTCSALLWHWWRQEVPERKALARQIACLAFVLALACLGGYVFIEIIPWRIWLGAQPYRLLILVKWIGCMLIARQAITLLRKGPREGAFFAGIALLAGNGPYQPIILAATCAGEITRRRAKSSALQQKLGAALCVAVLIASLYYFQKEELGALIIFMGIALWFGLLPKGPMRTALPTLGLATLISLLIVARTHETPVITKMLSSYQPVLTADEDRDVEWWLGRYVQAHTPTNSVFVVPMYLSKFRLSAQRAVVADFKWWPWTDAGMMKHVDRFAACYAPEGWTITDGAIPEEYYWNIPDDRLLKLAQQYGATHALLYAGTSTSLPILAAPGTIPGAANYKIVIIVPPAIAPPT